VISRIAERQPGAAPGRPLRPLTVGIDLRSGPSYPTGVAVMDADRRLHRIEVSRTDEALLEAVERAVPALVAIDAPLGLPEGRCCTDQTCECARHGIMREVDRVCAAAGYRPFPTLLPSMVKLTERGIRLYDELTARGHEVIEVYPGMAQDILGIPRKGSGLDGLRRGLKRAGVLGIPRARRVTHDELDAATCAVVAQLQLAGETETMGPGDPVPLVLPRREGSPRSATRR
jgi:predicted nuclease with RNAse H fold